MLDLFHRLKQEIDFPLSVAHLNHSLRGEESDRDEEFTGSMTKRMGMPFHSRTLPPGALDDSGEGLEAAARRARYAFLEETARRIGAHRVALGHTREDQAETLLLRLLRGSGPRGLAGIYPVVEGTFIRPLLDVSRGIVEPYLEARGLSARVDSSNADLSRGRNRVRRLLLPILREQFNPEIVETLSRTAEILREEEAYLDQVTRDLEGRALRRVGLELYLSIPILRALPATLRRRLLRRALEEAVGRGRRAPSGYDQIEAVERLLEEGRHGAARSLADGLEARVLYAELALLTPGSPSEEGVEVPLPVPGEAVLPGLGVRLSALRLPASDIGDPRKRGASDRALLDADALPGPLCVRARRPGDVFRPLGSAGESKLKSYLIDRKVPRPIRDKIPLVVSGNRIAWVVGFQIDDRYKVTPGTRRVVVLSKEMQ